ncbi:hypothetical protein L7F22_032578, partial [Adiantum nelumboides]|nr:hypothetical protein [Adiantum nelumboides]
FLACAPILAKVESLTIDLHGLKASPTKNAALIAKKEDEIEVLTGIVSINASFNDVARMKEEVFAMRVLDDYEEVIFDIGQREEKDGKENKHSRQLDKQVPLGLMKVGFS